MSQNNNTSSGATPIIPLEEGWEKEIKAKVRKNRRSGILPFLGRQSHPRSCHITLLKLGD